MIMTWPLKQQASGSTTSKGSPVNLEKIETQPFSVNQKVATAMQERTMSQTETEYGPGGRHDSMKNKGSSYSDKVLAQTPASKVGGTKVSQLVATAQKAAKEAREANATPLGVDEEDKSEPPPIECHIVSSSGISSADRALEEQEEERLKHL